MKKIFSSLAVITVAVAGLFITVPASASNPTLNFYVSGPIVQNTFVSGATIESFNAMTNNNNGSCLTKSEWSISTVISSVSSTGCGISNANAAGGATNVVAGSFPTPTTTSVRPTGNGGRYLKVSPNSSLTLQFLTPQAYLGFWWSAGDAGNVVDLYSGGENGTKIGSFTLSTLLTMLGNGTGTLSALDGTSTYDRCKYFGNPVNNTLDCNSSPVPENSAYVHIIGSGGQTFDTVVFRETQNTPYFEIDNIAISNTSVTPSSALVSFPAALTSNISSPNETASTCVAFSSSFGLSPNNFATDPVFSISPALPSGLSINAASGVVSGTPSAASNATTYTVTATAGAQTSSQAVSLSVNQVGTLPCPVSVSSSAAPSVNAALAETGSKTLMLSVAGVGLLIAGVMLLISRKLQVRKN